MKTVIAGVVAAIVLVFSASALADPSSDENGCHGYWTTQAKSPGDRGAQGREIGGNGNSDGNPANGQAHSELGRGATLQAFLAAQCGVGSQAP
jgi:hypothetical protein